MEIISLESENVKRLKAVRIEPDGKPVILTGKNEQGKSSIIDSLYIALTGKLGDKPVRDGATKARITLDTGEYFAERVIPAGGSPKLIVRNADGEKVKSPQTILDTLFNEMAMDPFEFARMKAKDQREILLKTAGIDLTEWEGRYRAAYDRRTEANRDVKKSEAAWQSAEKVPDGTPNEVVSATELIAEIDRMKSLRLARREALDAKERMEGEIAGAKERIADLERRLQEEKRSLQSAEQKVAGIAIPDAPGTDEIEAASAKLSEVEQTNELVRKKKLVEGYRKQYLENQKAAESADETVQFILSEKERMLAEADFGVPGLSISDDGVTFEDMPFSELSTARKIQVSVAMAMRQNPRLRIVIIREGALIGTEIWNAIVEQCRENGFQLWVEKFQEEAGSVGLHIEDGAIVARDGAGIGGETQTVSEED